jgi:uncharacterized protein (DUF2062 family)
VKSWALRFRASIGDISPEQAALLLSVGLVLGVFPIMGCPTVFCLLAACGLRLNLVALQLLNNISSPLQLALLLPLARAGAMVCGTSVATGDSVAGKIGAEAVHAIVGWACICVPLGALLYFILAFAMRRRRTSWSNSVESPA